MIDSKTLRKILQDAYFKLHDYEYLSFDSNPAIPTIGEIIYFLKPVSPP